MRLCVVVIGDELLLGQVTDTNSGFIARSVAGASWPVVAVETVGDDAEDIRDAIGRALTRADVVITTGGLGPTKDDITKRVLCDCFGGELRLDPAVLANVKEVMSRRGRQINDLTLSQAMVPDTCEVIQNDVGTAPIMWFERDGKVLVAMPGVPFETEQMFTQKVYPRLLRRFETDTVIIHRSLIVTDMSESALAEKIADIEAAFPAGIHLAYLPNQGYVRLRLDGRHADRGYIEAETERQRDLIASRLGDAVLWREDMPLAAILLQMLTERELTVATAESCTGGNIAHTITLVPGSSAAMKGGVVAYCNSVKRAVLGVDGATIDSLGAVSLPVVEQMARGACERLCADIAVATSGIAGPGGAVEGKPVGTVCIAVATPAATVSHTYHFAGNRSRVINHATNMALILGIKALRGL